MILLKTRLSGHKSMYKGSGIINGDGNYGFMISGIDENLTPSTDIDLFGIKIWDKDNHTYTDVGVYTVKLTVTDDDTGACESIFRYVVVYDTEGGFVTGGG